MFIVLYSAFNTNRTQTIDNFSKYRLSNAVHLGLLYLHDIFVRNLYLSWVSVTYGNSHDRYAIFGWREEDECTAVSEINNLFITDACGKNTFQDKSSKFRRHCSAKITVSSWSMEPNKAYYYDIAKRYLTLIGQWPYQKPKESLFFMIFVLFFDANVLSTQVTLTIVGIFLKESNYNRYNFVKTPHRIE